MPRLRVTRSTGVLVIVGLLFVSFFFLSSGPEYDLNFDEYSETGGPLDKVKSHQKALNQWLSQTDPDLPRGLEYTEDGYVRGWERVHHLLKQGGLKKKDKNMLKQIMEMHPIFKLMERGEKRWTELLERQSKTLPQAVTEYRHRYGRAPPKGFDQWWQFCKRNQYDQIFRDIEPFFALSPQMFNERVNALTETQHAAQITLSPDGPSSIYGQRAHSARPRLLFQLLEPIAQYLSREVTFTISDHDLGSWILGDDQKQAASDAIREGRYLSEQDLKVLEKREGRQPVKGLVSACPEGSPGWEIGVAIRDNLPIDDEIPTALESSFIYDPLQTYDYCYNPSLLKTHGSLSFDFCRETVLRPIFQLSKFVRNPELLTTPLEAYENFTSTDAQKKYVPWEEKTISKLFWRGSTTGDSYSKRKDYTWHQSHRPRLALMTQAKEGLKNVWVKRGKEWDKESWGISKLNEAYMDVGLTGVPHQCKKEDGTCDEMANEIIFKDRVRPEEAAKYKYVFDIDGNGWSSRFHRLIMSGSVVVKATIYPEWLSDWMTPWVHYIPCKIDYSDLYDIMSFFAGPPDGRVGGHDDLARKIAEQGKKFGEEHWRWEDMQAYMFRLMLEYARLLADDRQEWSYQKTYD
ncbi:uncharacterized protein IL334_004524 [Kwoniella shivajii]|uniref:Glycosyl transferase CAP10 domain-containing protein n=1 Tax=Kwoniella shivajii TaxID=564305 RepID=A0ABZ1D0J7_9TREE|nr:hypothetical protein IL334_004524 [Kwoniella shivajii]